MKFSTAEKRGFHALKMEPFKSEEDWRERLAELVKNHEFYMTLSSKKVRPGKKKALTETLKKWLEGPSPTPPTKVTEGSAESSVDHAALMLEVLTDSVSLQKAGPKEKHVRRTSKAPVPNPKVVVIEEAKKSETPVVIEGVSKMAKNFENPKVVLERVPKMATQSSEPLTVSSVESALKPRLAILTEPHKVPKTRIRKRRAPKSAETVDESPKKLEKRKRKKEETELQKKLRVGKENLQQRRVLFPQAGVGGSPAVRMAHERGYDEGLGVFRKKYEELRAERDALAVIARQHHLKTENRPRFNPKDF